MINDKNITVKVFLFFYTQKYILAIYGVYFVILQNIKITK